jgi:hypothetical protein
MSRRTEENDFDPQAELASYFDFVDREYEDKKLSRDAETDFKSQNYHVRKSSHPYEPRFARWTEKLRFIGVTRAELEDFFAVDARTMEAWAKEHREFARALDRQPTVLGINSEDIGLFNWLKDYRRGDLGI